MSYYSCLPVTIDTMPSVNAWDGCRVCQLKFVTLLCRREANSGAYRVSTFFAAKTLVTFPMQVSTHYLATRLRLQHCVYTCLNPFTSPVHQNYKGKIPH